MHPQPLNGGVLSEEEEDRMRVISSITVITSSFPYFSQARWNGVVLACLHQRNHFRGNRREYYLSCLCSKEFHISNAV